MQQSKQSACAAAAAVQSCCWYRYSTRHQPVGEHRPLNLFSQARSTGSSHLSAQQSCEELAAAAAGCRSLVFFFPFEAFFSAFKALVLIPNERCAEGSEHRLAGAGQLHGSGEVHVLLLLQCQAREVAAKQEGKATA